MSAMSAPAARSRLWPLIAVVLGIVATIALGIWQLGRATEKREAQARFAARSAEPPIRVSGVELAASDVELRRVEARGTFEPRYTIFIDNRIHRGVPGYHVVMPLRLEGSARYVLVNRGWLRRSADRADLPRVVTASEPVLVEGIAVVPRQQTLELSEQVMEGPIWQNLTIERFRAAHPIGIQPFMIRQENAAGDGLVREWDKPDFGIEKHYGYAFQWFALAATLLVFYAVTRRRRHRDGAT